MDTFDLLPSLAAGDLRGTSAPELVAAIFRARASGTLALEAAGGAEARVFFRTGEMCGCAHFEGFRTLAQVLLANEWVGALAIDETRAAAAEQKKRHGEVLVERGLLTAAQLGEALALQHRHNLAALLQIERGRYEWRGWEPPPAWAREASIEPVSVIAQALESRRLEPRREAILRWLGGAPVRLSVDWPELSGRIELPSEDRAALRLLRAPLPAGELAKRSGVPGSRAESLLVALLLAGGVEPVAAGPQGVAEAPASTEDLGPAEIVEQPAAVAPRLSDADAIARIEGLELDRAPEGETSAAEARAPEAPPAEPAAAVAERPRAASDDVRRRLRARGLRNLGQGHAAAESASEPSPSLPAAEPDAEALRFIDEVRLLARRAPQQTPYQRLGVEPSAPQEAIRAAYLERIKRYHPDRAATPALAVLLPELRALFDALQEAQQAIGTATARAAYDRGEGKGGSAKEAEVQLKMGDVLLKKRDFAGAVARFRHAVSVEKNGDTLAALAWALMTDPGSSAAEKDEARVLLQRALDERPTARAHYVAGVAARASDPAAAAESFRKALELDPDHPDAALELRLLEMRSRPKTPAKTGLSGWFSKRKG